LNVKDVIKNKKNIFHLIYSKVILCLLFFSITCSLSACKKEETVTVNTYSWNDAIEYEAEDGVLLGGTVISNQKEGYSGTGYVEGFTDDGDGIIFKIEIPEEGFYDLNFVSASNGGDYKENYVLVDGENIGNTVVQSAEFTDSVVERVYLKSGEHEVLVSKYWGWILLDELKIKKSDDIDPSLYEVNKKLCNPNASENAQRLYSYLCDMYGSYIISGQFSDGMLGLENTAIYNVTGEYPAILGLDFIDYSTSRVEHGATSFATESAINYWNSGGIVTITWHWNAPEKYLTGEWYSGFYTDYTNIDLTKILSGEDQEGYDLLMDDIDAIAKQLQILKDAGVPVLWRPLHEASGGWFWWGSAGPEEYKELYRILYDRLTNKYELNNLIWVWNGQDKEWYPGDEYVDIIGWDVYPGEQVYSAQTATFLEAASISDGHKMIVMSENGCLFNPDLAFRDGATWGYFCTWSGEFVLETEGYNTYGGRYTDESMLRKVYQDERVITRDELPDLKNYPISK